MRIEIKLTEPPFITTQIILLVLLLLLLLCEKLKQNCFLFYSWPLRKIIEKKNFKNLILGILLCCVFVVVLGYNKTLILFLIIFFFHSD